LLVEVNYGGSKPSLYFVNGLLFLTVAPSLMGLLPQPMSTKLVALVAANFILPTSSQPTTLSFNLQTIQLHRNISNSWSFFSNLGLLHLDNIKLSQSSKPIDSNSSIGTVFLSTTTSPREHHPP
jgi:hypothetical protein